MQRNFKAYGPFAAVERVLMALGKAGADRQEMHERLRTHAMAAWESVQKGLPNPLVELVVADPGLQAYLPAAELRQLMDASVHLGDAPARALTLAALARSAE